MAKQGIKPKHLFMGGLAIAGVYVANEMYKQYKLDQAKKKAIAGTGALSPVLNQIAPGVPAGTPPVIVLPPTAGLVPCEQMFPNTGDLIQDFVLASQRVLARNNGQCT